MPSAITFPIRRNGRTCFTGKGPPDRWRVHFPTDPRADELELMRPEALQAKLQSFLPTGKPFDIVGSNLYVVHQRVAQKFRSRPRHPGRRCRPREQPDRRHGHELGHSRRDQSRRQAHRHRPPRSRRRRARSLRAPAPPCRRRAHAGADHAQQKTCWPRRIRRCGSAITTNCAGPRTIRHWRANICCARRCSRACAKPTRLRDEMGAAMRRVAFWHCL